MKSFARIYRAGLVAGLLLMALPLTPAAEVASPASLGEAPAEIVLPPGPLPTGDFRSGPAGVSMTGLATLAVAPAALLWLGLALACGWRTDPLREQRAARRGLRRLLRHLADSPSAAQVEAWRGYTARVWNVGLAEPTAVELAAAIGASAAPWTQLWLESEKSLYSSRANLPADWSARARAAFGTLPPLARLTWAPALRRHWFPAAVLVLMTAVATVDLRAADAAELYASGKFGEAEKAWSEASAKAPGDWALHHNAALAAAQAGKWGEAAGHWTAAWRLNPGDPAVSAGVRLSLAQLDGIDSTFKRLLIGRWPDRFAARLSVSGWETLAWTGAALASAGLILVVVSLYAGPRRVWRLSGVAVLVVGVGASYVALDAIKRNGPLANRLAVFVTNQAEVRAIPSELITNQQAATLFPGMLVEVDRTFLSWDHIVTDTGVEGWVRSENVLWLYEGRATDKIVTVLKER